MPTVFQGQEFVWEVPNNEKKKFKESSEGEIKVDEVNNLRIMGLDLGEKTIGIALSDPLKITAQGLMVMRRKTLEQDLVELDKIKEKYEVEQVVVGLPRMMNGSIGPMGEKAQEFADILLRRWGIPVHTWDERLSTMEAEKTLLQADLSRKKRKKLIDKTAAVLILQSFLGRRKEEMKDE